MSDGTERLCQFFLRGRCQRENCEFKHDLEKRKAVLEEVSVAAAKTSAGSASSPMRPTAPECMYFKRGACKIGDKCRFRHEQKPVTSAATEVTKPTQQSEQPKKADTDDEPMLGKDSDDDLAAGVEDSDDESLASGFTDAPNASKKETANVVPKRSEPAPPKAPLVASSPAGKASSSNKAEAEKNSRGRMLPRRAIDSSAVAAVAKSSKEAKKDSKGPRKFSDYFSDDNDDDVSEEASAGQRRRETNQTKHNATNSSQSKASNGESETIENIQSFIDEESASGKKDPKTAKAPPSATPTKDDKSKDMVKLIFGEEQGSKKKASAAGSKRDSIAAAAAANDDYMIVFTGVNMGLSGKYWSDSESLPSKRRRVSDQPAAASPAAAASVSSKTTAPHGEERRGRGRPPKKSAASSVISEASEQISNDPEQSPSKRGRGRPKKSDVDVTKSDWQPTVSLDRSSSGLSASPRKSDSAGEKPKPKEAPSEPPKPASSAQSLTEDESEAEGQHQAPAKRGPGRPKKFKPDGELNSTLESSQSSSPVKRPLGRPKKARPDSELNSDFESSSQSSSPVKRPLGRPKKTRPDGEQNSNFESSSQSSPVKSSEQSSQSPPAKRPPGRPKKSDSTLSPVKRPPGRPKKSDATLPPPAATAGRPSRKQLDSSDSDDNPFPVPTSVASPAKKKPLPLQKLPALASGGRRRTDDEESVTMVHNDMDASTRARRAQLEAEARQFGAQQHRAVEAAPSEIGEATTSGQNRNVSCLADSPMHKEVVVECFAPYDDHRWVNIGKERDGMAPDAVQYARALRPPYHLLSFLRIKGFSTKGMSCTDKNTMVFVVLEGEVTVVLHTTQFNATKGDSFYIPPKNFYNLINVKAREAELCLIQFQYDGPLPSAATAAAKAMAMASAASAPNGGQAR